MRRLEFRAGWPALLVCLALLSHGCSPGDGDGGDGDGSGGGLDGDDAACAVPAALEDAVVEGEAERRNQPGSMGASQVYRLSARLSGGEPADFLSIELWDGFGVFRGGKVATGTHELAGAETRVESCGACVFILADVEDGLPAQVYLARSGTLVIDSVLPELTGSLEGAAFGQLDAETDELMAGGCAADLGSVSYGAPVTCHGGGGGSSGGGGGGGGGGGSIPCE